MPILTGLQPTETVLRGGHLKQPIVLSRLRTVGDKQFIYLWRSNRDLTNFLTDIAFFRRPLKHSNVLQRLADLRNTKMVELMGKLHDMADAADAGKSHVEASAVTDSLDMDDEPGDEKPEEEIKANGQRKHVSRRDRNLRKQLPKVHEVSYDRPGDDPWTPMLLMEAATVSPAMEVIDENFTALFELVDRDLTEAVESGPAGSQGVAGSAGSAGGPADSGGAAACQRLSGPRRGGSTGGPAGDGGAAAGQRRMSTKKARELPDGPRQYFIRHR